MKPRSLFLSLTTALLLQIASAGTLIQQSSSVAAETPSQSASQAAKDAKALAWTKDLNLTAAQQSQLQSIQAQSSQNRDTLYKSLTTADRKLLSLLQSQSPIPPLREQYRVVADLRYQLNEYDFEILMAQRQVLTPTQLAKVIEKFRKKA
jgi:Spy/CpxP family protein refolding chaperone